MTSQLAMLGEQVPLTRDYNKLALAQMGIGHEGQPADRARVAIGFVDYGFDLLHPTLCDANGERSRFKFLWDQNRTPHHARAEAFDAAAVDDWNGAFLDDAVTACRRSGSRQALDEMYDPHAHNCGRHGTVGGAHGTMMASIAAGTPFAGFTGAAPQADLIGVQLALADHDWKEENRSGRPNWHAWQPRTQPKWDGWRDYGDSRQIVNAVRYIYHCGCWLGVDAVVVNLSIGAWAGSHSGQSTVERGIAGVIAGAEAAHACGRGPRIVVVVGAGNAGADEGHWQATVVPSGTQTFEWVMQRGDPTQNKLEIWYRGDKSAISVSLALPTSQCVAIEPGATQEILSDGKRIGIAEHWIGRCGELSCVTVLLDPALFPRGFFERSAATCAFVWNLTAKTSAAIDVHAWIERDDGTEARSWFSPSHPQGTLCCLAAIDGAVVVGGYDHREDSGSLALSGAGPLPWRVGAAACVPHFVAPASGIWGARSKTRGFVETTGTSVAVAMASGAIARHLAAHGADAPLPQGGGSWHPRSGFGPLTIDQRQRTGVPA